MSNKLIETWQKIIVGDTKSWVLFENGTVVILTNPESDLSLQAINLMKDFGKVYAGSPAGDFSVIDLEEDDGWAVTCHHPDILTYVSKDDVGADASEPAIGLAGRSNRNFDADELKIIHVEDKTY